VRYYVLCERCERNVEHMGYGKRILKQGKGAEII